MSAFTARALMRNERRHQSLAILGTASDVGKSVTVTALCRIFSNQGMKVAPFKAQNMSNNSFVSLSQGELARAQAVQAEAARLEPTVEMNPILLKPSGDRVSQVIVDGKAIGNRTASEYFSDTTSLAHVATRSFDRLKSDFELVIIEGAGSCAEVNLRSRDFTNFEMAHHADAPVLLVADIDRGGVFAQVIGTLEVLEKRDRERVKGVIVNRFRGDPRLFEDGIEFLETRTGIPVLGLIPCFSEIRIDSEDGLPLTARIDASKALRASTANVAVILLPHISNFTDFLPLELTEISEVHFLRHPRSLQGFDLVMLPGSKNVRGDLQWIHDTGWARELTRYHAEGGVIGGICGGYQMLGQQVRDPHGIEGPAGETPGLKLLPVDTVLEPRKQLHRVSGIWTGSGHSVSGYEIHHGATTPLKPCESPLRITERNGVKTSAEDGAIGSDGRVWGCYLHGLFDDPSFRQHILKSVAGHRISFKTGDGESPFDFRQRQYDLLAQHFERHLDLPAIRSILAGETPGIHAERGRR